MLPADRSGLERAADRLQPALLDRLVDDAPQQPHDAVDRRVVGDKQLRRAVLRDLGWLLNAIAHGPPLDGGRYPHAEHSVLNYGLPTLSGQFASSLQRAGMEKALRQAILDFEPRILPHTLEVEIVLDGYALESHNRVGLEIRGMLWAQPVPMEFLLRSRIDLEEGRFTMEDISR